MFPRAFGDESFKEIIELREMTPYQEFIFLRTYARYLWGEGRRETFVEAVDRYLEWLFTQSIAHLVIPMKVRAKAREAMLELNVLGSNRALWTAGAAADVNNCTIYNCAALAVDDIGAFGEALYLLMAGCGVGFSIERRYISELPVVKLQRNAPVRNHVIADSREGWKEAVDVGIETWVEGRDLQYDYSQIRPKGAPLKTMGGRSSGPDVLRKLLDYMRDVFMEAQGRQLTSLQCHDLMCEITQCVIAGGVRRSAMISLSDLWDMEMRNCKIPPFHPRRHGANNSAMYYEEPNVLDFLDEFVSLARSGTGERGIANLWAARRNAPARRDASKITLLNPCGEVALRNHGFCNLTEVVIRPGDTFDDIREKVTTSAWLGLLQATFTNFPHLHDDWSRNAQEEMLCGVSLTGQFDNPSMLNPEYFDLWRDHTVRTLEKASRILGVNMPAAATCVKPSGTASQLVGSSAGLHPRYAKHFIRNVLISKTDPLFKMMAEQGVPWRHTSGDEHCAILSFPQKSPDGAVTRHDLDAIEQLEHYLMVSENWCEHNASTTIYVRESEWLEVAQFCHKNFDALVGVTFFPSDQNNFEWTPYQECSKDDYERALENFPEVDYTRLPDYEEGDETIGSREYACAGGSCDV